MKIGFISQYFLPEPGAAAHPGVVARALSHRGHEVRVLTGFPSYPQGEIYPGYQQSLRFTERIDGMQVRRVPYFLSHDESGARRAASMITFGLVGDCAKRGDRWQRRATRLRVPRDDRNGGDGRFDDCAGRLTSCTSRTSGPTASWPAGCWRIVLASSAMSNACYSAPAPRCTRVRARIAVIADGMKDVLVARGVPADKVEVVYNWVDEHVFREAPADPELASALHERAAFALMYAGGMGELQALETAVDAMRIVGNDADVHLALVGEGVSKARLACPCRRPRADQRLLLGRSSPCPDAGHHGSRRRAAGLVA